MSTRTGVAPHISTAATVATAVWDTVITSSPGPIPSASQRKVKGLCSVSHAHGIGNADVVGELSFKGGGLVAQNVAARR